MTFRVGQKVVCVDDGPSRFSGLKSLVRRGAVYTIAKFWFHERNGLPVVLLDEISPDCDGGPHDCFDASRFRPIVDRTTDISFTEGAPKDSEQFDNRRKVGVEV